jgi:RimJ/RimL family protein N-acetyltransferase
VSPLTLRPADPSDEGRLLEWRNEPTSRAASLTEGEVSPEDHKRWYARKLADPSSALFIVMDGDEPVGQIRLDRIANDVAEVSIGLAPEARGRGIGRRALVLAALEAESRLGVTTISARIKSENVASLRSFEAAGFREVRRDEGVVELRRPAGESK